METEDDNKVTSAVVHDDDDKNEMSTHSSSCKIDDHHKGSGSSTQKQQEQQQQQRHNHSDHVYLEEEIKLRKSIHQGWFSGNIVSLLFVNGYSALLVFIFHLISLESLLSIALSVGLTIYTYNRTLDSNTFDGGIMDWVLLSFAVITPMSASIGMAFTRRDKALEYLAIIKSSLKGIYTGFVCWDWSSAAKSQPNGRAAECNADVDYLHQSDVALDAMVKLCSDLSRMLTLPSCSRARHRVTPTGRKQAARIEELMDHLKRSALRRMLIVSDVCEKLKYQGMPGNEAARLRQWERFITEKIELLVVIKRYRTPQALRSFARIFSVFLPPFYAPFYGQMAQDLNSLGMAIAFSVLTSIALTSLFESIAQIEDPFVGAMSLDGINVADELQGKFTDQLLDVREYYYKDAPKIKLQSRSLSLPAGPDILLFQAR